MAVGTIHSVVLYTVSLQAEFSENRGMSQSCDPDLELKLNFLAQHWPKQGVILNPLPLSDSLSPQFVTSGTM